MRGEPVPSVMLTIPTPEIPAMPLFNSVPELFAATTYSDMPNVSATFAKESHNFRGTGAANLEDPSGEYGALPVDSSLLRVPARSPRGLGFGVAASPSEVLTGDEHVQEAESPMRSTAMDSQIDNSHAILGDAGGNTKVSVDKQTTQLQVQKPKALGTKIRRFFSRPLQPSISGPFTDTNLTALIAR